MLSTVEGQGINFPLGFEVYFSGLLRKPELYWEGRKLKKNNSSPLCTVLGYASFAEVDFDRRHDDVIYD